MSKNLDLYDRVQVVVDTFTSEGVSIGSVGYIIEVFDNGKRFEVELSDAKGVTVAQIVVEPSDIDPAPLGN